MSEVEQLFQCIVCPKAYRSKQSLRAHMKVHKREGYLRTNIFVRRDKWAQFEAFCKEHKTTTCHLLDVLVEATLKGKELGVIDLGSPNPVVIQVQHVFLGAPRGRYSHVLLDRLLDPRGKTWPPSCESADQFLKTTMEVGCLKTREWVSLKDCWTCYRSRGVGF